MTAAFAGTPVLLPVSDFILNGDRIQFTAPDKSLDVANRDLGVIESILRKAALKCGSTTTARSSSAHRIIANSDHGYAVTSHSAQGLTAERVLIHTETSVHPDLSTPALAMDTAHDLAGISCHGTPSVLEQRTCGTRGRAMGLDGWELQEGRLIGVQSTRAPPSSGRYISV